MSYSEFQAMSDGAVVQDFLEEFELFLGSMNVYRPEDIDNMMRLLMAASFAYQAKLRTKALYSGLTTDSEES